MFKRLFLIFVCLTLSYHLSVGQIAENSITEREYWFDGKIAERQPLGASVASVDISGLAAGLHSLTVRVKDDNGVWSSPQTKYFVLSQESTAASQITEREYWFDGKIAERQSLGASVASVGISGLAAGLHSLTVRVKDDKGVWSSPLTKYFVLSQTNMPDIVVNRCRYWIDDDEDNAVVGALSDNIGVYDIDVNSLALGEHTLSWMVCNSRGVWSKVYTEEFTLVEIVEPTSVGAIGADAPTGDDAWYDLSGRRLTTPPTTKGIYIHNGRKVIIIR